MQNNTDAMRSFFNQLIPLIPPGSREPYYDKVTNEVVDHVEIGKVRKMKFDTYISLKENYYQATAYVDELAKIVPQHMRACALVIFMRWNADTRNIYFAIEGQGESSWLVLRYTFESNRDPEADVDHYLALRGAFSAMISQRLSALIERIKRECDS